MIFLDTHPEYQNYTEEQVIEKVPLNILIAILFDVASAYDVALKMGSIYQYYGYYMDDSSDFQQVPCLLPSHGTGDKHPSSRFYSQDRNTGAKRHSVYCFKCQKAVTPFWLLYNREAGIRDVKIKEIFTFIYKTFRIPFPRTILYNFDAEAYYMLSESECATKRKRFQAAEVLMKMKESKDPAYLTELKRFIVEG